MNVGWFRIPRSILETRIFANATTLKVYVWCKAKANFTKSEFPVRTGSGETEVTIEPGQFLYGRNKAEQSLGIPGTTIDSHMRKLAAYGVISIKPGRHFSIVTLCDDGPSGPSMKSNWQAVGNHQAGNGQPPGTYKKGKKAKKAEEGIDQTRRNDHARASWKEDEPEILRLLVSIGKEVRLAKNNLNWAAKACCLVARREMPEAWLVSGLEAIRKHNEPIRNKSAFLFTVLEDEAKNKGHSFPRLLQSVGDIPEHFKEAYRKQKDQQADVTANVNDDRRIAP